MNPKGPASKEKIQIPFSYKYHHFKYRNHLMYKGQVKNVPVIHMAMIGYALMFYNEIWQNKTSSTLYASYQLHIAVANAAKINAFFLTSGDKLGHLSPMIDQLMIWKIIVEARKWEKMPKEVLV